MEIELLHVPQYEDGLSNLEREGKAWKMSLGLVGRNLLQMIRQLSQFMDFYEVIPAVLLRRFLNILRSLREVFIVSSKKISELGKFVHDGSRIHFRRPR